MENSKFNELSQQRKSANEKLGDLYMKAANRELTAEEKMEEVNLTREIEQCEAQMRGINLEVANQQVMLQRRNDDVKQQFRELLKSSRDTKSVRTITLVPAIENAKNNIEASGAIELTIRDLIPTIHEGLGLPVGLDIITGVIGNEVWPVGINDVEMEEKGENATLTEQDLNFANITPSPKRTGICVSVSNAAIDNAAFDLMGYVQGKFEIALRVYLAKKIYSQAQWDGNKGPFSGLTAGTIELGANAYANILNKVAEFTNKGFLDGEVCLSMDKVTEAELKATPKIAGAAGGFVIENGLCAGYPYTTSHYVNTELDNSSPKKLVPTSDRYIEIGFWNYFALQQHGMVRLTVDGVSAAVAKDNVTKVVLNTAWSMTDLSIYINGGDSAHSYPTQAFGLYKVVSEPETE